MLAANNSVVDRFRFLLSFHLNRPLEMTTEFVNLEKVESKKEIVFFSLAVTIAITCFQTTATYSISTKENPIWYGFK